MIFAMGKDHAIGCVFGRAIGCQNPNAVLVNTPALSCPLLAGYGSTGHANAPYAECLRKLRHLNATLLQYGLRSLVKSDAAGNADTAAVPVTCWRGVRERVAMPVQLRYRSTAPAPDQRRIMDPL